MKALATLIGVVLVGKLLVATEAYAQQPDSIGRYTPLDSVVIQAYGSHTLMATPAAVNVLASAQWGRFANGQLSQAINVTPGIRMEERSPGSYRLNIRGSSVRSPYGVRNVKIYYDGIPFTAPGGSSALNMLGLASLEKIEVIKGPGSSLYGEGTGGVLLFEPQHGDSLAIEVGIQKGSYQHQTTQLQLKGWGNVFTYEQAQGEGYREHSAMKKQVASYHGRWHTAEKQWWKMNLVYSVLDYQTPGALTLAEYQTDPRKARPATGTNPSAAEARAGIFQKALLWGVTRQNQISPQWKNTSTAYFFYHETHNPTIQNYERRHEPHWGGRSVFNYTVSAIDLTLGAELQQGNFKSTVFDNQQGNVGLQRYYDRLQLLQWMGFAQLKWSAGPWLLTAGASVNQMRFDFIRHGSAIAAEATKRFSGAILPRGAVLYRWLPNLSAYINVSKGFSPPATNEIFADNSSYNLALQPEQGWNIEPGLRGRFFGQRLFLDISYFHTGLSNSIVTRRDEAGGNYYLNAGKTQQRGVELATSFQVMAPTKARQIVFHASYSRYWFKYLNFVQLTEDYSGKQMPGVAPEAVAFMADIKMKQGFFGHVTLAHQARIALNDANSEYAAPFQLLSAKVGYHWLIGKLPFRAFIGADNLLDQRYSLGNDINGFGGRYYNVAAPRTFYGGLSIGWKRY